MANIIPSAPKSIQMMNMMLIAWGTLSETLTGKKSFESLTPLFSGLISTKAIF